jgi:hypothetical protein
MFTVLDQRRQAKMQWLQDPNQSTIDNLNNVRREASRHFRNKKKEYLKPKIGKLENNRKTKRNSEKCIGASITLRRFNSLQLRQQRFVADSAQYFG